MSVTEFTTRAAWIAGLAMLALVCLGWRKTARAAPKLPRAERRNSPAGRASQRPDRGASVGFRPASSAGHGVAVTESAAPSYRRTPIWRRLWALGSASFLAVLAGAIIAIVSAFAVSWVVTTLSSLLKR